MFNLRKKPKIINKNENVALKKDILEQAAIAERYLLMIRNRPPEIPFIEHCIMLKMMHLLIVGSISQIMVL